MELAPAGVASDASRFVTGQLLEVDGGGSAVYSSRGRGGTGMPGTSMLERPAAGALAALTGLALLAGCVSTDPYTGEQRVDAGSTALAVAALAAVGGVAYAASRSGDDDDDDDHDWNRYYRPASGVRCYRAQRACYDRNGYSAYWTRREFGKSRR